MNSVERVQTPLEFDQPDRMPVIEFVLGEKAARAPCLTCVFVRNLLVKIRGQTCYS